MKKLLFYASAVAVLFSSCSKDAIEESAINVGGHEVFTASINVEDENKTRLHLEKSQYSWDVADAIGVSSASVQGANIPVTAASAGSEPNFVVSENDYNRWLNATTEANGENPLYVYFPYQAGKSFSNGKIELTIPATQRYEKDSFFRNEVSAVGYAESWSGAGQKVKLKVPTALIRVNVLGWGDLAAIKLTIKDKGGNDLILAGSAEVNVVPEKNKEYAPALTLNEQSKNASKEIIVTFGELATETLTYASTIPVHFILPAGINLSQATLTFTPKFKGEDAFDENQAYVKTMGTENLAGKMDLRPNLRVTIEDNIALGLQDKFLVMDDDQYTAEEKFLAYAYFAQPQTDDDNTELSKHFKTASSILNADELEVMKMPALIIDNELDFAAYDKTWAETELKKLEENLFAEDVNHLWMAVYNWYIANGGAIESLTYNGVIGLENATIKNLNVVGTGLSNGASLENLTLQNITVTAPKGSDRVGLIAPYSSMPVAASYCDPMTIEKVAISTGNKVVAEEAAIVGGIYGTYNVGTNLIDAAEGIAINATSCPVVGRLYGHITGGNIVLTLKDKYDWDDSTLALPVIGLVSKSKTYDVTADIVINKDMLNGGIVGRVEKSTNGYTGSVLVADTYYWNGGITNYSGSGYDNAGNVTDPLTAEELAVMIALGNSADFVFTHNIDMQGDHLVEDAVEPTSLFVMRPINNNISAVYTVDGKTKTLSNVNWTNAGDVKCDAALFGRNATIKDLTVTGLTINAVASNTAYVSGLAYTGKAENVTVNDVTINVAGSTLITGDNYDFIGAVFAKVNAADIKNVTANNVAIVSEAKASAGLVAGKLELSGETSELNKITVTGSNKVTVAEVRPMTVKNAGKYDNFAEGTNYAYAAPFGIVQPMDAATSVGGQVNHKLTVKDCSYGDKLAAGYWVNLGADIKNVAPSAEAYPSTGYAYVFASNANAGDSAPYNNIAFSK